MNNWRDKLYRFMQGRYGRIDELGRFLMYLLFGLLLVSFFVRSSIFSLLILLVLIYDYYRILSKDISARYQENQHYIQAREKVRTKWNKLTGKSRRQHPSNYTNVSTCGQKVRVPKGKGKYRFTVQIATVILSNAPD
ncbi:MAG: hypothetical protein ACLVAT_11595 [Lachnospiraceae bacterium]